MLFYAWRYWMGITRDNQCLWNKISANSFIYFNWNPLPFWFQKSKAMTILSYMILRPFASYPADCLSQISSSIAFISVFAISVPEFYVHTLTVAVVVNIKEVIWVHPLIHPLKQFIVPARWAPKEKISMKCLSLLSPLLTAAYRPIYIIIMIKNQSGRAQFPGGAQSALQTAIRPPFKNNTIYNIHSKMSLIHSTTHDGMYNLKEKKWPHCIKKIKAAKQIHMNGRWRGVV